MALHIDDYTQAIDALFARTAGRIKPGLSRTEAMLLTLNDPHKQFPAFHVAGTNGKGSVCATIDALLRCKRLRVGRYTSPHLVDFRERILIDGVPISEDDVLEFLARVGRSADVLGATFFEITTVMAFWYFAKERVDVAVIETGLGGAYDSTNVIDPVVATVTNIGLDHTEYLGSSVQSIADEKAGIFKTGRGAVIGEPDAALARRLADRAAERRASPVVVVQSMWQSSPTVVAHGMTQFSAMPSGTLGWGGEIQLTTPLLGGHQAKNALTAITAVWTAGEPYRVPAAEVNGALATVSLPGRFQRAGEWIFDVAHNPAGAQALANTLESLSLPRPVTAVVGVLGDKDWRSILDALAPAVDHFIITQPWSAPSDRAWNPLEAGLYASRLKVPVQLEAGFDVAMLYAQSRSGTKVVTGSFHTVGDAMGYLGIDPFGK